MKPPHPLNPTLIIFPRGTLTVLDKTTLRRAGYCALNAMAGENSSYERAKFTAALTTRLNTIEASKVKVRDELTAHSIFVPKVDEKKLAKAAQPGEVSE